MRFISENIDSENPFKPTREIVEGIVIDNESIKQTTISDLFVDLDGNELIVRLPNNLRSSRLLTVERKQDNTFYTVSIDVLEENSSINNSSPYKVDFSNLE